MARLVMVHLFPGRERGPEPISTPRLAIFPITSARMGDALDGARARPVGVPRGDGPVGGRCDGSGRTRPTTERSRVNRSEQFLDFGHAPGSGNPPTTPIGSRAESDRPLENGTRAIVTPRRVQALDRAHRFSGPDFKGGRAAPTIGSVGRSPATSDFGDPFRDRRGPRL